MFKSLFSKKSKELSLTAPLEGKVIGLEDVPDQVFAQKMMGDGVAIIPESNTVVSPLDGEVADVFQTKHAISFRTSEGAEILIHMGLDTVNMKGEGFEVKVETGAKVKKGDPLAVYDLEKVKAAGYEIVTPIILLNGEDFEITKRVTNENVNLNDELLEIVKKS